MNELQRDKIQVNEIRVKDAVPTIIVDTLEYSSPKSDYGANELVTAAWVLNQSFSAGGAQKISLPSSAYPDSVPYADSDRVTVNIGDSLTPIVGAYEVNARLIVNGAQYDVPPNYTYGIGGRVTSIFFEVGGVLSGFKINFEA